MVAWSEGKEVEVRKRGLVGGGVDGGWAEEDGLFDIGGDEVDGGEEGR